MSRILARAMTVRAGGRWAHSSSSSSAGAARAFATPATAASGAASSPQTNAAAASSVAPDPAGAGAAGSSSHSHSTPPPSPDTSSKSSGQSSGKDPPSLFRVMLLSTLTAGALYLIKLAYDIEHEPDVTLTVDRWIEQREAAADQSPLLPPAAAPSKLSTLLSRSGRSIYAENAAEESLGDPRVLAALSSVHPALPRMERMTRRMIVWPGLNFFSRVDLCKMYAEQGQDGESAAVLQQQCLSKLNNPSRRRRHERNALELLGVARVLEVLARDHERPEEIQQAAQCRFKEAATLLRALIKHYREVIGPTSQAAAATPTTAAAAAPPSAPVPMHLHLGLVSALLGAREFGAAMAELDSAQHTLVSSPEAVTPEHKEMAQKKIAQCKSAIEKAKGTHTI